MEKQFHELLEELRIKQHISKKMLAERARVTPGYISLLSRGERSGPSKETVEALANALGLNGETRVHFFSTAGYTQSSTLSLQPEESNTRLDWSTAPDASIFLGRKDELAQLEEFITQRQCKIINILGLGGIGKTSLAAMLGEEIQSKFQYAFWRSLRDGQPLRKILEECIHFLSDDEHLNIPLDDETAQPFLINRLLELLSSKPCLIVFDNFETVMQSGERAGEYKKEHEGYGILLRSLGEAYHRSCIILTSREKPKEIVLMEGETTPVKSLLLGGLQLDEIQQLLTNRELSGSKKVWEALLHFYGGNPLALKLIAEPIQQMFDGDIEQFLQTGAGIFGDIQSILHEQFERLTNLERSIMYWLAIERESVSFNELQKKLDQIPGYSRMLGAISSLQRRSLIEAEGVARVTLQPVIMGYVTDRFVEKICNELKTGDFTVFCGHALLLAQAKDYIREAQKSLILAPILSWLLAQFSYKGSEEFLKELLKKLPHTRNYAVGNTINLLIQLDSNLRAADFSHLMVREAFLQGINLPQVNFSQADLTDSVFTDSIGSILSITISPDAKYMAAGTDNGDIRLWDFESSQPLHNFTNHTDWVHTIEFSPDGKQLVSGSEDETVRIWDVETGNELKKLDHESAVYSVAFSPDGKQLASGSDSGILWIWDLTADTVKQFEGHKEWIRSVAFSPDGTLLASGSADCTVRLWNVASGQSAVLEGHDGWVYAVAFSPDGTLLASGSADNTVRVWDIKTKVCRHVLREHTNWIRTVAFSKEGIIASGCTDQKIILWNAETGQRIRTLEGLTGRVWSIAFSPNGRTLVSGTDDQTIRLWEVATGKSVKTLQGHTAWIRSISFSPNGKWLAGGGADQAVHIWDMDKTTTDTPSINLQGHKHWIWSVAFSPDSRLLASSSDDVTVRIWDIQKNDQQPKVWREHSSWVGAVAFSPDGLLLASGSQDQSIRLWDVPTGKTIRKFEAHTHWVGSVAFSPDGTWLASGSDDTDIRIWDIATDSCIHRLTGHHNGVSAVVFSPDGALLASASQDQTVKIWNVRTGEELHTFTDHKDKVFSVAFSPDGKMLASAGADLTIRLWNVADGRCVRVLTGHNHWIYAVAFHPDGKILASSDHEGIIHLWDIERGARIRALRNERPYEDMNITGATGLTSAQRAALKSLGAVDNQ
ncbi:hypothetical protein KDA_19910 [Dictyobacter alpinus]|uniref:HTH cro/C1-type domain-containing protein n=1 Tax=Dictyobacter alpinus TaxID=2014873 RepID=A0A402B584_9CHLR|nr:helix-turn-helix domain-containing protein [Dictyobacter alpinus]GCE26507.1 hypothetical protein KDA_19910 [Dictyobacter alpinus]